MCASCRKVGSPELLPIYSPSSLRMTQDRVIERVGRLAAMREAGASNASALGWSCRGPPPPPFAGDSSPAHGALRAMDVARSARGRRRALPECRAFRTVRPLPALRPTRAPVRVHLALLRARADEVVIAPAVEAHSPPPGVADGVGQVVASLRRRRRWRGRRLRRSGRPRRRVRQLPLSAADVVPVAGAP